jgi:ATP-dependent protease ClpP protease subunit
MPELIIRVPSYIGPSYLEVDEFGWAEWVQGITKADVEMQVEWAKMLGEEPDSILLEIGICDGGSTVEGFNIYNYLVGLKLPDGQKMPIRCHITALAASMAVPLALAADEAPEMEYTAQLMLHSASFNGGVYAETSVELRAQADRLDNTNQLLFDLLTARTGQPADVVNGWLQVGKDTWLTASQAKAVGLCSKVIPLTAPTTAVQADTVITARRKRATEVLARRSRLAPQATTAAAAAPIAMPDVKKPIGQAVKPTPRAAAQPAAKPAAQPKARKSFWQSLKEFAQQGADEDEAEASADGEEPTAETQSTVLAGDNGTLYHDGALAVDSVVYFDEALTETADAGEYDTDSQTITVGEAGVVTAIDPIADASATGDASATALAKRLDRLEAKLSTVEAENTNLKTENAALKKIKPALPVARGARANSDAPDPKAKAKATQPVEGAGTL